MDTSAGRVMNAMTKARFGAEQMVTIFLETDEKPILG